jgi:hypothetical protein
MYVWYQLIALLGMWHGCGSVALLDVKVCCCCSSEVKERNLGNKNN